VELHDVYSSFSIVRSNLMENYQKTGLVAYMGKFEFKGLINRWKALINEAICDKLLLMEG
jgi:hypothetical protein